MRLKALALLAMAFMVLLLLPASVSASHSTAHAVAGEDCTVDFAEVLNAIGAFNSGEAIDGKEVTFNDVLDAIGLFNSGETVAGCSNEQLPSYSFSGSGADATESFNLSEGFVTINVTHNGTRFFDFELLNLDTGEIFLSDHTVGDYEGTAGDYVPQGEYVINFEADGNWSAQIEQPRFSTSDATAPPVMVSGNNSSVRGPYSFEEGLALGDFVYDGESNFIIHLVNVDTGETEYFVNQIGDFRGEKAVEVDQSGMYMLTIDASGRWDTEIDQPTYSESDAESLPISESGSNHTVLGPYRFDGATRFNITAETDGNVVVWLADAQGGNQELLVNEIGDHSGETVVVYDGLGILKIEIDGPWNITARSE